MSIRVLIADDHEVVRKGLASLLRGSDIKIVAEAKNGDEAVTMARKHHPDVVLLDIRMPGSDGLIALKQFQSQMPETKVVVLSTFNSPTYVAQAVALGASDYVLKGSSREELIAAITAAANGESATRAGEMHRGPGARVTRQTVGTDSVRLTNREMEVLQHLAQGATNKEIGRSLSISIETVKEHVQNLLRKIDGADRTQAAVWAVRDGLGVNAVLGSGRDPCPVPRVVVVRLYCGRRPH